MTSPQGPDTARSSVLVGAGIALSRLLGLARSVVLAASLGTTPAADAFRAALRIPQLLQNLLGEGALSAAFIPAYARLLEQGRHRDAGRLAGAVAGLIAAATAVLVLAGTLLARPLTVLLAPGFTGATYELTVTLTRIMTAGIGLVVLAAWCLGVLNAHRKFFLSYAAPVVWNAAQIVAVLGAVAVGASDPRTAELAAWGVLVGGALQFLVQLPAVLRVAPHLRVSVRTDQPEVRLVLRRFGPAMVGRGIVQIGAYLDLLLASLLVVGSVTVLDLAQILYLLPISLFVISIAAAELPELSRTSHDADLLRRLGVANRRVAFFMVGTTVAFVVGGASLVPAVFQWGAFDATDSLLVWGALAAYSLALVPTGGARLLQNGLFARGDTAGPAAIAGVRVLVAAAVGVVLMFQLERVEVAPPAAVEGIVAVVGGDARLERTAPLPAPLTPLPADERADDAAPARLGVVGLALGSALAAWVEYGLLRRRTARRLGPPPTLRGAVAPLVVPGAAATVAILGTQALLPIVPLVVRAGAVAAAGAVAYLGVGALTGVGEVRSVLARLAGRRDRA